jgi:hypothetical protein
MAMLTKKTSIHAGALATGAQISEYYVKNFIPPLDIVRILNAAKVRFMLVGAHGLAGWRAEPRATQDVDILVGHRQHQKAVRVLLKEYPHLQPDDQEVVIRLRDAETGDVLIDIMKATQPLFRDALRHTQLVESEGIKYKIPTLEMALAMKFAPMISIVRVDEKKYVDAADFIRIVKKNPNIDLDLLAQLGELVYPGGGKEIVELVRKVQAGEKLQL